jgi:O-antigen/teichoic acid export membrane protein
MIVTPLMVPLLFGVEFAAAVPAALILVGAAAVAGLNVVIAEGLKGLGHPVFVMRAEFSGLGVTVVSLLLLLRPLEVVGAALASLLGYTAVTIFLLASACRLTEFPVGSLLWARLGEVLDAVRRARSMVGLFWYRS